MTVLRFYTRSAIALGWLFIRAQSAIRADGSSAARHCTTAGPSMPRALLRAARANRVSARIEDIRTENAVLINTNDGSAVLYKIGDCARMAFHPGAIGDPRGRVFVRAILYGCGAINAACALARCARQPRFRTDRRHPSGNAVPANGKSARMGSIRDARIPA